MTLLKSALLGTCCAFAAIPAQATVYTGSHTIDTATVNVSLTTDGTVGVLSMANVTAWSFTLTNPGGTVTLDNSNSNFTYLSGSSFQATAADIVFDYSVAGHMQWDNFGLGGDDTYCLDAVGGSFTCIGNPPAETVGVNGIFSNGPRSGRFVLGTAAAVPEPATWALMIGGFAMAGAAARRRTRTSVTYA
jgi:hypothetical protein